MARGNDAQAAYSDLVDRFGAGHGRAEDLIEARLAAYPVELVTAQNRNVDANATALIDDAEVAEVAGVSEEAVVSKAVRGDVVVAVIEGDDGRTAKVSLPLAHFEEVADEVGQESDSGAGIFASDVAQKYAEEKSLTSETIASLIGAGEGKDGAFTKKDVAKAVEAKVASSA